MTPMASTSARDVGRASLAARLLPGLCLAALLGCGAAGGVSTGPAPVFTSQPVDATVVVGNAATFQAAAGGSPTYQWTRGGVAIPGAIGTSYTTPATAAGDDQAVFALAARTAGGTTTSASAVLHVNYATVTAQPASAAVNAGDPASLTVTAAGSGTLTYQWQLGGQAIPSANAATYAVAGAALTDGGVYTCTVTSALNGTLASATSIPATLTVGTAPVTITGQPADATVVAGQAATFAVSATNVASYQWYCGTLPIVGATGPTYTTPPTLSVNDQGQYSVVLTNGVGLVRSTSATLHVNYVNLPGQPGNQVLGAGTSPTLAVTAASSGALTYQWSKDGVAVTGATGASLALANLAAKDAGVYLCAVTSALNGTTLTQSTQPARITVVPQPVISVQPLGGSFVPGTQLNLHLTATGSGALTYQWLKDGTAIPGATSTYYLVQAVAATDAGSYTCVITNSVGLVGVSVTSAAATVVVQASVSIAIQPVPVQVSESQTANFSLVAQGVGTLTYQWYRNGTAIPGATATSYTTPSTVLSDNQSTFYCIVTSTLGTATPTTVQSATALLTVVPLVPSFQASTLSVTAGQGVIFTYLFSPSATATLGPAGGTAAPVTSGSHSIVYPAATTTYTLTVTENGTPLATSLTVNVHTYSARFLYVINNGDNDLWQYPVNPNAVLITNSVGTAYPAGLIGKAFLPTSGTPVPTGKGPIHMATTPDEKYLYVVNNLDATLNGYTSDPTSGQLTAVNGGSAFPLPTGYTRPYCAVCDPAGARFYVGCAEGIAVLTLDSATGNLLAAPGLATLIAGGRGQGDLVMHPSGKFLYAGDTIHSVIKAYAIDASTGALKAAGSDQAVTYPTGFKPYLPLPTPGITVYNGGELTLDRAGALLFARSTDPNMGPDNAAIDSFAVDPYTGALTHLSSNLSLLENGDYLVDGYAGGTHGLIYSGLPGIDHLYDMYDNSSQQVCWTEWTVDANPASATYGSLPGYYADINLGQFPHAIYSDLSIAGGNAFVRDRSGFLFAGLFGATANVMIAYGSDPKGTMSFMGNFATGEALLATGNNPVHGCFIGTTK